MDSHETDRTGTPQACAPCPAQDGPFNAGTAGILRRTRRRRFPLPSHVEGLLWRLGPDGERPPGIAVLRAYTRHYLVAVLTILGRELHLDDSTPAMIHRRHPARAGLAGRAGRVPLAPIKLDVLGGKADPFAGLPVIIEVCGPQEIHAIGVATFDEECGVQKTGVHDMGPRQEAPLVRSGVALEGRRAIGRRADGGFNLSDQVRQVVFAGFRAMPLVTQSLGGVLARVMGCRIGRGAGARHCRGMSSASRQCSWVPSHQELCIHTRIGWQRRAPRAAMTGHPRDHQRRAPPSHRASRSASGRHGARAWSGADHPRPASLTAITCVAKSAMLWRSTTCGRLSTENTLLEELAQHLQDVAAELRPIIRQEYAVVRPCDLARQPSRPTPLFVKHVPRTTMHGLGIASLLPREAGDAFSKTATDQPHIREAMIGSPEGQVRDHRRTVAGKPGDPRDAGGVQRFDPRHRW
jgi:hypothetical protein